MPIYKALPPSPTFVAPALGTPASGVMTNVTGTAANLTAGLVTTNANLTGDVTSVGNATTIAAGAVHASMLVTPPSRYIAIDPVVVVNAADPADTNYVDVDVTAQTSATCYAVTGNIIIGGATAGRAGLIRPNGSTDTSVATQVVYIAVAGVLNAASFTTGVDVGQIFEYKVSNADVSAIYIGITGYWETVA